MIFPISLLVLLVAVPTHQASDLIAQTCDQTLYKDYCKSALGSAPANDLPSFASFALKMASSKGVETRKKIDELRKSSGGESLQRLDDCSENYQGAIDRVEASIKDVGSGSYGNVNTWVTAAMSDVQSCEDGFKEKGGTQSPLNDDNTQFKQLCSIILTTSNLLAKN